MAQTVEYNPNCTVTPADRLHAAETERGEEVRQARFAVPSQLIPQSLSQISRWPTADNSWNGTHNAECVFEPRWGVLTDMPVDKPPPTHADSGEAGASVTKRFYQRWVKHKSFSSHDTSILTEVLWHNRSKYYCLSVVQKTHCTQIEYICFRQRYITFGDLKNNSHGIVVSHRGSHMI